MITKGFRTRVALGLHLAALVWSAPAWAVDAALSVKVSSLTFQRPAQWESVPTQSQMRKAVLKVPNQGGEAGEIIFFHFGAGNGGGTQANVDRWFRQFQEPKEKIKARTEETKAGNNKLTYVFAEGTYMSGMPGGPQTPKPGFGLVGAILEDPAGHIFVRYTGPKSLVDGTTADFKKLIASGTP